MVVTVPVGSATMGLEMRSTCEQCETAVHANGLAYICSYECTFCGTCTRLLSHTCPNCDGELVRRPTRVGELHEQI
jgi:uncharacterized protein